MVHAFRDKCIKSDISRKNDYLTIKTEDLDGFKVEIKEEILCSDIEEEEEEEKQPRDNDDTHNRIPNESERKYVCGICGRTFIEERCLKGHYLVHSDEKPFKCDLCTNSYKRPYALKVHQKQKHDIGTVAVPERVKKFACEQCNARFYANTLLQAHMRKHTGEKPHECTICGKGFIYINYLRKHMFCHQGKRFKCERCGKGFTRDRYLKKHIKRDH